MTKTLAGTWLAEVRDDSLWDSEPYYPSLDEGNGTVLNGEWPDARWALLNHLSEELSNVASQTCGPCEVVDPDGTFDRLETRLVGALKSLRKAEPGVPWEFNMDGSRYRLFVAGQEEASSSPHEDGDQVHESFSPDAFASWVSPQIVLWGDSTRRGRRRRVGGQH
ncbi:MAG: hypothetical protein ABSD85_09395 [Acidimicrobiales bacterium]|jgi:hypothetical protein